MKLCAIMPCRNEEWVLAFSARVALMWCDMLFTGNHGSTDRTAEIILELQDEFPGRVINWEFHDQEWMEMIHRQILLDRVRACGGTHVAIVDCDEVLTGNLLARVPYGTHSIIYHTVDLIPQGSILQLPGYNLRGSLNQYHNNGIWGNRWFSVAFADDPRLGWSGDKFHSREPQGVRLSNYRPIAQGDGGIMHLWGASERRLIAKHSWYKVTERLRWPEKKVEDIDAMYNLAIKGDPKNFGFGVPSAWTYAETKPEWWLPYAHIIEHLDVNAEPWQEQAVRDLVKEHGPRMFQGLDLFGLV